MRSLLNLLFCDAPYYTCVSFVEKYVNFGQQTSTNPNTGKPMKILIKQATVVSKQSQFNNKKVDVLIEGGIINQISEAPLGVEVDKVFEGDGLHLSLGFADITANFADPGFEYKEDFKSGAAAAIAGGYTAVGVQPTTQPALHTKSEIEYVVAKSANKGLEVWPIGSLFVANEGKDLAELYDMQLAGAVAFSDAKKPIADAGALSRAIQYAGGINSPVMVLPYDKTIAPGGMVNEGEVATRLGLKGIPALAEELMVARNIALAEYNNAPLHFTAISTQGSVALVRKAKAQGLAITAGVNFYNLFQTDEELTGFDSNFKVTPPLRTQADVDALIAGLQDGTIDIINADHTPENIENKDVEFDFAAYGMIGFEVAFAALNTHVAPKIGLDKLITILTENPRKLFGRPLPDFAEGAKANFTLFNPTQQFTFEKTDIRSKSKNTPFVGTEFTGKVVATILN
jgi:dihydroorotase